MIEQFREGFVGGTTKDLIYLVSMVALIVGLSIAAWYWRKEL